MGLLVNNEMFIDWPPNALQFRRLCIPNAESYGLETEDAAFNMAIGNNPKTSPEVIYTLKMMGGSFDLREMKNHKDAKDMWRKWYSKTVMHVLSGGQIPKLSVQIPAIKSKPASEETANNHLSSIRDFLNE